MSTFDSDILTMHWMHQLSGQLICRKYLFSIFRALILRLKVYPDFFTEHSDVAEVIWKSVVKVVEMTTKYGTRALLQFQVICVLRLDAIALRCGC